MNILAHLRDLSVSGMYYWVDLVIFGVLLLVFFFAPALERRFAPWRKADSQLASIAEIVQAISGLALIVLLVVWLVLG